MAKVNTTGAFSMIDLIKEKHSKSFSFKIGL